MPGRPASCLLVLFHAGSKVPGRGRAGGGRRRGQEPAARCAPCRRPCLPRGPLRGSALLRCRPALPCARAAFGLDAAPEMRDVRCVCFPFGYWGSQPHGCGLPLTGTASHLSVGAICSHPRDRGALQMGTGRDPVGESILVPWGPSALNPGDSGLSPPGAGWHRSPARLSWGERRPLPP